MEGEDNFDVPLFNLTVSLGMLDTELIDPIRVKFLIGKTSLQAEVDTGATVSCMPLLVYKKKLNHIKLSPCKLRLKTYSEEIVTPEGEIVTNLNIMGVVKECKFMIVRKAHRILLGRDIVSKFNISVNNEGVRINEMWAENINDKVKSLLSKYSHLFKRELGTY